MSNDEAEKAAREIELMASQIAYGLSGHNINTIGEKFELARAAALRGVNVGVEWERKRDKGMTYKQFEKTYFPNDLKKRYMASLDETLRLADEYHTALKKEGGE